MKYCMKYDKRSKYIADEIKIEVNEKTNVLLIPAFLEEHPEIKRTIVVVNNVKDFIESDYAAAIAEKIKDYNVAFCAARRTYSPRDFASYCRKYHLSFFFEEPVVDWDTLYVMFALGVSDIYISESMGFELDAIKELADKNHC